MDALPVRHAAGAETRKTSTDPPHNLKPVMEHYVGIDVGTGSARACIINANGDIVGLASENIGLWQPQQGYYVGLAPISHLPSPINEQPRLHLSPGDCSLSPCSNHVDKLPRNNLQTTYGSAYVPPSSALWTSTALMHQPSKASASMLRAPSPSFLMTPMNQCLSLVRDLKVTTMLFSGSTIDRWPRRRRSMPQNITY